MWILIDFRAFCVLAVCTVVQPVCDIALLADEPVQRAIVAPAVEWDAQKTVLFSELTDGFTVYRIPGLVVTARGSVLAYCEARKYSTADRGEIEIHLRRSVDGGVTFDAARQVAHRGIRLARNPHVPPGKAERDLGGPDEQTVNNPLAIATAEGPIQLLYCVEYQRVFQIESRDDGVTWSSPREITPVFAAFRDVLDWQVVATGPGHAVQSANGRLCVAFWMATYAAGAAISNAVGTIYSDDGGATWHRGDVAIRNAVEPNIAALPPDPDGSGRGFLLTARNSRPESRRLVSRSADGAVGWSEPVFADELPEPGCMAGLVLAPGRTADSPARLLFSGVYTTDRRHSARRDLTLHISLDGGRTWPSAKLVQRGPSAYSDLAVLPDGTVLCFYESGTDQPVKQRRRDWAYANLTLARGQL